MSFWDVSQDGKISDLEKRVESICEYFGIEFYEFERPVFDADGKQLTTFFSGKPKTETVLALRKRPK